MNQSQSIGKLSAALIEAQKEFDTILKDKDNPFFRSKYADLASVIEATQPSLQKHGLVVMQFPVSDAHGVGVATILSHISGEFISEFCTLPLAKQDAQTGVAATTYARRAGRLGVLGIAAEDDDGNTASARNEEHLSARFKKSSKAEPSPDPSGEPVSSEKSENLAAGSSEVPGEDEVKGLRNRFRLLGDDLATAGLKASAKMPIAKKMLAYLLQTTGATEATSITRTQWATFYTVVDGVKKSDGGFKELVRLVEAASKPKTEETAE